MRYPKPQKEIKLSKDKEVKKKKKKEPRDDPEVKTLRNKFYNIYNRLQYLFIIPFNRLKDLMKRQQHAWRISVEKQKLQNTSKWKSCGENIGDEN